MSMKRIVSLFLDLRRTSEEFPLSRRKFQELIKTGRLSACRMDGKLILRRQDIEHLLAAKPLEADLRKRSNFSELGGASWCVYLVHTTKKQKGKKGTKNARKLWSFSSSATCTYRLVDVFVDL